MSAVKEMANHALTTFESLKLERKKGAWILEPHDHDSMRKLEVEATKAKDKNLFYVTSCLCCFCVSESFPRSGEHIYSTTRCSAHSLPPCQINLAVSSGTSRDRWQLEESMAVLIFFVKHVGRSERLETDCCSACGAQIPDSSMATLTGKSWAAKVWFRKHIHKRNKIVSWRRVQKNIKKH